MKTNSRYVAVIATVLFMICGKKGMSKPNPL